MKKTLTFGLALLLVHSVAQAITIEGSAIGAWSNVIHDSSDIYSLTPGDNNTSDTESFFNWGTAAPGSTDNQFGFNGINAFSAESGEKFLLGNFNYRNGTTYSWTADGITGVSLDVQFGLTSPISSVNAGNASFDFTITNTPNHDPVQPVPDGDIVALLGMSSNFSFVNQGIMYNLTILGFSVDNGSTISNNFSSPEGGTASAGLYAKFEQTPVPEPATLLLFGLGVSGFLARRRFASMKR